MKIIAFDLGANFAFAHNLHGIDPWGRRLFPGDRQTRQAALLEFLEILFSQVTFGKIEAAFYERPFARGQHATRSLWGMAGIIEAVATQHGLPVLDMPPVSIKKFATGNAKATKADMILAAQRLGYAGDNEHEADAFCGLKYAEANMVRSLHGKE